MTVRAVCEKCNYEWELEMKPIETITCPNCKTVYNAIAVVNDPENKEAIRFVSEKTDKSSMKQALVKFAEPKEKRIVELEAQIEKMKCGGNCEHLYHVNTGGCYDAKCDLTYCDCINCKDKWELRR